MAGRVAKVFAFVRDVVGGSIVSTVTGDPGGGANRSYQHFAGSGDDSQPLTTDFLVAVDTEREGAAVAVGYHDPVNAGIALPGEQRSYSRDPATGLVVGATIHTADGSIVSSNAGGSITLSPDGTMTVDANVAIVLNCDDVRIGNLAGQAVARVGDLVSVTIPPLLSSAPGSPCIPVPPTAITPTGGTVGAGQIISGSPKVKAG